jgi:hypothetical protein
MKKYQVRNKNEENTPENNGFLVAEFESYKEANEYLKKNINRYPNAFVSVKNN